jgi:hypothetical protein
MASALRGTSVGDGTVRVKGDAMEAQTAGRFRVRRAFVDGDVWPSLAIAVIWLAVLLDAVFGPDIVSRDGVAGIGQETHVPSAVVVALFAWLTSWAIAKHAFRRGPD